MLEMPFGLCCLALNPVNVDSLFFSIGDLWDDDDEGDFPVGGTVGTVGTSLDWIVLAGIGTAVETGTMRTTGLIFLGFLIGFLTRNTLGSSAVGDITVSVSTFTVLTVGGGAADGSSLCL
jgi:hypothetical protein